MSLFSFVLSVFFFFKQKTAYEMRISDWSSDVCSSDLEPRHRKVSDRRRRLVSRPVSWQRPEDICCACPAHTAGEAARHPNDANVPPICGRALAPDYRHPISPAKGRSEEHTSELQSLMRTSYAVF